MAMTTFICFVIAIAIIYIMKLSTGGFDVKEFISYTLMVVLLGAHVYLSTRKKAIWGLIVPVVTVVSFYPVYKLINPDGFSLIMLILLYIIAFVCFLYIWYRARKDN